jgi:hypothetical protein
MKLRFVVKFGTNGRTNGDIEALADGGERLKTEFKNLDDSEVLSSDFPDHRTSADSMTSTASTTSMASMTFTASFLQNNN